MAEEDLIFGKNRHMFGGIEPSNMLTFSIISKTDTIKILAVLPNDTVINDQTLCTVAGAVIRRRTDRCPVDEFDGDLVADIKASGTIIDSTADLSNTYYYAAFPYTAQGVYNRNKANIVKYNPSGPYYIYGYDLDTTNADPDSRVIYPSDVDNELFEPAKMNFTETTEEGTFSYGSWPSTPGDGFMPRPCMLTSFGRVDYYLDPNDYTKKFEDGTASDYDNLDYNGNVMMEWAKIYTKRELVDGIYKFRCAPVKVDDSWECWCNYNINNKEIDHFYTSVYKRSIIRNNGNITLRSINDQMSANTGESMTEYLKRAKNNYFSSYIKSGWTIEVLSDHLLIQDLLVMMAKTTDLKSAYGDGWSETTRKKPGGLEKKGLFYGAPKYTSASTQTGRVKIFGMEDYWDSQLSRRLAGWINDKGVQKVKLTQGTKDGSTATDYNVTGDGYLTIPDAYSGSGGYISECTVASYGRIPVVYSGSKTTYECDYVSSGNLDIYPAIICGILNSSENRGPFSVILNKEEDYTSSTIGASLSCKPTV